MKALVLAAILFAQEKGTLPEVSVQGKSEADAEKSALAAEILISKTESQAIESLKGILKKRKGTPDEPQLWFRLAELYMRRAKSGRFFDLFRERTTDTQALTFAPPTIRDISAKKYIQQGIDIYTQIEKSFPRYVGMDEVLFNNGFAHQGLGKSREAELIYNRLVDKYPNSSLMPDVRLALGEIAYDNHRFNLALEHLKEIEKYPTSRVYSYGLYKAAWTLYNLRKNQDAIDTMVRVVEYHDPRKAESSGSRVNHNLRTESLRDLTIFFGDLHPADFAVKFFARITTEEELGEAMLSLGKLYNSHSRFKEVNTFLSEFISKYPMHPAVIRSRLLLVDANESAKNRKEVIQQFQELAKICEPKSSYRKHNGGAVNELCDIDFNKNNLEIAKKWWEIWLKNKGHDEFANLTRQVFEIYVVRDPIEKPDTKARYAFAELLFQQKDFRRAAVQYEIVGTASEDAQTKHDANYSALVSAERANELKKQSGDDKEILRLSQQYLTRQPKGQWVEPVQFKVGLTHFQNKNLEEAEKWLKPLAVGAKDKELVVKAQDVSLEILNQRKNFVAIRDYANELLIKSKNISAERQARITQIMEEADLAHIQEKSKKSSPEQSAKEYGQFVEKYPKSPLAKEALWQALSLRFTAGFSLMGADLAVKYSQLYPKDEKVTEALKEAAKNYFEAGLFRTSAQVHETIAERVKDKDKVLHLQAASELYRLEKDWKKTKTLYEQARALSKEEPNWALLYEIERGIGKDLAKFESKLLADNREPWASELRLKQLNIVFEQKNNKEAFDIAKDILSSKAPDAIKAQARYVHGQIFEQELVGQGLKTSLDRLPTVLSLKTEKLDRAQTAYLQVARMAGQPELQLRAFEGLLRCYRNYVDSVSALQVKGELAAEEIQALQGELQKLVAPIVEKKNDVEKQLAKLEQGARRSQQDWSLLGAEETSTPATPNLSAVDFPVLLPTDFTNDKAIFSTVSVAKSCPALEEKSSLRDRLTRMNDCVSLKKWEQLERNILLWTQEPKKSPWPLFYSAVHALSEQKYDKARSLIDLALKRDQNQEGLNYFLGLVSVMEDGRLGNNNANQQGSSLSLNATQHLLKTPPQLVSHPILNRWAVSHFFKSNKCADVLKRADLFSSSELRKYQLVGSVAECRAQGGEADKALGLLDDKNNFDMVLQKARVLEKFKIDFAKAKGQYELALGLSASEPARTWLQKKIGYLSGTDALRAPSHTKGGSGK